jgi:hypothetical protein
MSRAAVKGNIFVPEVTGDRSNVVTILKVGPGCVEFDNSHIGQRVVIPDNVNGVHRVQGEEFLVRESTVLEHQPYILVNHG